VLQPDFLRLIKIQYEQIAESARASGNIFWMVGAAYFHHSDPSLDLDQPTKDFLRHMQEHYFDISLNEYVIFGSLPLPSGYVSIGYFTSGIEAKDSPPETVIQNYFAGMG